MYREQKKGKNVPPKSGRETGNGRADKYSADGSKGKNVPPKSSRETGNGRIDRALRREMRG